VSRHVQRPQARPARSARRQPASALRAGAAALGLALFAAPLALAPSAVASSTGLVISEVYGGGGNTGAPLNKDFIELHNTSSAPVDLTGLSVQYRSASGSFGGLTTLSGSIPAGKHWLISEGGGATGSDLPAADASGTISMAAGNGVVYLARATATVEAKDASVIDLVGYGTASTYEGSAAAPGLSNTTSATRAASGADTDNNAADFTAGAPQPENVTAGGGTQPPAEAVERTLEEIQGNGASSPLVGQSVITDGVVTAAYPTGGFNGFFLQTPGTGGEIDPAHDTSNAVFVFLGGAAESGSYPAIGDHVRVTGKVSEFAGLTELSPAAGGVTKLAEPAATPAPATVAYPSTDAEREALEGMLVAPQGSYTVTDNYSLNQYAEIGLARGTEPLRQPTDVARPGAAAEAVEAANATKRVTLDDGASSNFLTTFKNTPLPYLTPERSVRVGAPATFTQPVVLDYRNGLWKLQPRQQLTAANAATVQPVTFADTRTSAPKAVGGDLKLASFNVLNFFTETGADFVADGGTCTFYGDRDGNPVTVNSCNGNGPRGAADDANLARQRAKIVSAINALGADVLSLEEIENSAQYAGPDRRDDALAALVEALNAAAGSEVWRFVPSPPAAERPAVSDEDVIRTAFIYKKASAEPVGSSHILQSPAFDNARDPLAQAFRPAGGAPNQTFVAIVNHFKSKGSGVDDGSGQGNANPDRVAQAKALVAFADEQKKLAGTDSVFLTGDFNAYTQEEPMQVLYDAGYTDIGSAQAPEEATYLFDGVVGSLDHVLANETAYAQVTGAHVWNINSVESVAYEYSRYNYNATDFYAATPFRSSDHDPLLVGIDVPAAPVATTTTASVVPEKVVVRDTTPTVTAKVGSENGPATGGTVTVSSGSTVLGSAPVADGTAEVRLPAFEAVGPVTLSVRYSGAEAFESSATTVTVSVVKATPTLAASVRPAVVHKRVTQPLLDVRLEAAGQVVTGYVVVRQDGAILGFEQLTDGRATVTLPSYKKKGTQTVTVEYLGSELAEAVTKAVTFDVEN
jgi:5'-nucleotidase